MSAVTAVPLRPLARGSVPRLWIAVGLLVLVAVGLGWWGTRGLQRTAMPSGVQYQVIREGEGDLISSADLVAVHFVARRQNGEVLADSRRGQGPLTASTDNFPVPGLGDGLKLMRKGSVYRFWVPPSVYQGQMPAGLRLQPNEVLSFDVDVVDVQQNGVAMMRAQQMQEMQRQIQGGGNSAAPAPAGNEAAPSPSPRSIPAR